MDSEPEAKKRRTEHEDELVLNKSALNAQLKKPKESRKPISLRDITNFLYYCRSGKHTTSSSRWVEAKKRVKKCIVINLITDSINTENVELQFKDKYTFSAASVSTNRHTEKEMLLSTLIASEEKHILAKYGSVDLALREEMDHISQLREEFPIENGSATILADATDNVDRRKLLLPLQEVKCSRFPLPSVNKNFRMTKPKYRQVSSMSPMFAVDCEMVFTDAQVHELAEVAIINEKSETVYHSLVKPKNKIVDYLTKYSGITEERLKDVTKTLEDVQDEIINLLPDDAILIGHAIENELQALHLLHPYIIDTSIIFNDSGKVNMIPGLKKLTSRYLGMTIQQSSSGHSAVEDATATLKLAQFKLQKSFIFGNAVYNKMSHKPGQQTLSRNQVTSSIIGTKCETTKYCDYLESMFPKHKMTPEASSSSRLIDHTSFENMKIITKDSPMEVLDEMCICTKKDFLVIGNIICEETNTWLDTVRKWEESIMEASPSGTVSVILLTNSEDSDAERLILLDAK